MSDTLRPWPEYARPTSAQLAEWLKVCTDEERVKFAECAIRDSELASGCFTQNHHGLVREVARFRLQQGGETR